MTIDVVYHVGHLAVDRDAAGINGRRSAEADDLNTLAYKMQRSAEHGKVILYQRRVDDKFEYHARAVKGA